MQYLYQNLINLRKLAIKNRFSTDIDVYIEKCYRHYSKTYGMPLEQAYRELAPEQVILVHMEDEMEDWTPEEIEKVQAILSNADKPVLDPGYLAPEDMEITDDEWIAQQEALAKKADADKKEKQTQDIARKTHEIIQELTDAFKAATPKQAPPPKNEED